MHKIAAVLFLAAVLPAQQEAEKPTTKPEHPYALMIGDPAPPLSIQTWVKGDPVDAFARDKVYVVEFWATWCGPCIAGMPHLSELQEKYAEQGVRIIGVNIWDEPENVGPFMENDAPIHDKPGDEIMRYTVAIERKHDPEDIRHGKMSADWMKAAGRNGIPSAFIVNQEGRIAWIGHPSGMDEPLAKVVAGEWDLETAAKDYVARVAGQAKVDRYNDLFRQGKYDEAYALGREIVNGPLAKDAMGLNSVAWAIVDPDNKPEKQDLELAMLAAQRANELTESKDPYILDTLATVHFDCGKLAEAVKWQKLAAEHAKGEPVEAEVRERLEQFEKALAAKKGGPGQTVK